MTTLTYDSHNRTIVFEPIHQTPQNGFITAKDWLNSRTLATGNFPKVSFHVSLCRLSSPTELADYQVLKDHSKYALNATE